MDKRKIRRQIRRRLGNGPMAMLNKETRDVMACVRGYWDLLDAQERAPDFPYTGMPYSGTIGAADQRWDYFRDIREYYGEDFADIVNDFC